MLISIIGAGCVGSVLAKHLYNAGNDVTLIAVGSRADKLSQNGLEINGEKYNIPVAKTDDEKPDLLFVCVKNYDLEQACVDMKSFINKDTIIIPLLNSVSPTPTIQNLIPENRVLYGYISKIDAYRDKGEYKYNVPGEIHFGYAKNSTIDNELMRILNELRKSGFDAHIDEDMVRGIWKKWMLNVGANQVSALTEADYLQFAKIAEIENVLRLAMQELLIIACYENVNLSTDDVNETIKYLTTYPFPKRTSMLQDVLGKRKTEIDYISGDILKLCQKWNCPCPVNLTMYYLIKSKEKAYLM